MPNFPPSQQTVGQDVYNWLAVRNWDNNGFGLGLPATQPAAIQDGNGNTSPLQLSQTTINISINSDDQFTVNGTPLKQYVQASLANVSISPNGTLNAIGTTGQIIIENGAISIDPTYLGQESIATVGRITKGEWANADKPVGTAFGGTGNIASNYQDKGIVQYNANTQTFETVPFAPVNSNNNLSFFVYDPITKEMGWNSNVSALFNDPITLNDPVTVDQGGTGLTSVNQGAILLGSGSTQALTTLAIPQTNVPMALLYNGTTLEYNASIYSAITSNITALGTIASGVWNGSTVEVAYGGTGLGAIAINSILYAVAANQLAALATIVSGLLITDPTGVPSFSNTLPLTVQQNITNTGTISNGVWNGTLVDIAYGGTNANTAVGALTNLGALALAGGTMLGALLLAGDPTVPLGAATKEYVDNLFYYNPAIREACVGATTAELDATYASGINGDGIGATLTSNNVGAFTLDNISSTALIIGARILVKDQVDFLNNGIYTITNVGSGSTNWVLTRSIDFDIPQKIQTGLLVNIIYGAQNQESLWVVGGIDVNGNLQNSSIQFVQNNNVGIVQIGTWNASVIGYQYGGTGTNGAAYVAYSPLYFANGAFVSTAAPTANDQIFTGQIGTSPVFSANTIPQQALAANSLLYTPTNGNINALTATTIGAIVSYDQNGIVFTTTLNPGVTANIAVLGTITAGVWQGTVVAVVYGGTGSTSFQQNCLIIGNGTNGLTVVPLGSAGEILTAGQGGIPTWTNPGDILNNIGNDNEILYKNAITHQVEGLATNANGVLVTDGTGAPSIGNTLSDPVQTNITKTGTITQGTWNGDPVAATSGGTGLTSAPANSVLYTSAPNTFSTLTPGANNVLIGDGGGNLSFSATLPTGVQGNITQVGNIAAGVWGGTSVGIANGGTGGNDATSAQNNLAIPQLINDNTFVKQTCRVATTGNLNATYVNGTAGVNATLTNSGTQVALNIDSVTLVLNQRVLVKDQTDQTQNGIYTVTNVGSGSTNWIMTRATDMDQPSEFHMGDRVLVRIGTINGRTEWTYSGTTPPTIGITLITFSLISLSIMGGTLLGDLILYEDPTLALGAATKQYVDNSIVDNSDLKTPVRLATPDTFNLIATYSNGTAGVGATLINAGAQVAFMLDGATANMGDRILVRSQTNPIQNGIYVVTNVGSGSTNWGLTRATDFDTASKMVYGVLVYTTDGSTYNNRFYSVSSIVVNIGADNINFIAANNVGFVTQGIWDGDIIPIAKGGTSASTISGAQTSLAIPQLISDSSYYKIPCSCATTGNLTATYNNGTGGVGATLTNNGAQTTLNIDGLVALTVNTRVLVKNQTSDLQNGIYIVTNTGSPSTNWVMTRATDYDGSTEIHLNDNIYVSSGSFNQRSYWQQIFSTPLTVGVSSIDFIQTSLPITGGTMAGTLTLFSDPVSPLQAATKEYVDNTVNNTIIINAAQKLPCLVATTGTNLTATYSNGTAGVGATLTNNGTLAALVIDGVTVPASSRVLIKDQTDQTQNGIYTVTNVGSGSIAWILTRATDFDEPPEMFLGAKTEINSGTVNNNSEWRINSTVATVGTSIVTFNATYLPITGGTMLGALTLNADPTTNLQAATKQYADTKVAITGSTMTGLLILSGDPTVPLGAATKEYVDNNIVTNASQKIPCVAASTGTLVATYNNGTSGVGATLTNFGTQTVFSLDGVAATLGQRVLIKNQLNAYQNGIYTVNNVGSGSTNWILVRATDFDQTAEVFLGDKTLVTGGTLNIDTEWYLSSSVINIGSDAITFAETYLPIVGGTLSGNLILNADPTTNLQAATKQYVDNSLANNAEIKIAVRLATPDGVNLTVTYNNGTAGVGATLTNAGTQVALSVDGLTANVGNRILIKSQLNLIQNGIYVVTNTGSGSTNWVLTRSTDFNTAAAMTYGTLVYTTDGSAYNNRFYSVNSVIANIGTDNVSFAPANNVGVVTQGTWNGTTVAIANGGTGANNAPGGLSNLGGVALAGSTMTGPLILSADPVVALGASTKQYADTKVPLAGGTMTGLLTLSGNPTTNLQASTKQYVDTTTVSIGGSTMTGPLILSADPVVALGATTKQYADTKVPLAGGTMTGLLTLSANPTTNLQAATKQYADTKVALAGSTMTGPLILSGDPTVDLGAATRQYVNANTKYISSVLVATTTFLLGNYVNGTAGVGATLTNVGPQTILIIDGITLAVGNRVLVKDQAPYSGAQTNGIYVVTNAGNGLTNWVLTRSTDFNDAYQMQAGGAVYVVGGTVNIYTTWQLSTTVVNVGTDPITFLPIGPYFSQGGWTPGIQIAGQTVAPAYNTSATGGSYKQIGNIVFYSFFVTLTSKGTAPANNAVSMNGLPINSSATANYNVLEYGNFVAPANPFSLFVSWENGNATGALYKGQYNNGTNVNFLPLQYSDLNNNSRFSGNGFYFLTP